MAYTPGAMERAMKVQEIILRALSGQLTWLRPISGGGDPRGSHTYAAGPRATESMLRFLLE